MKGRWSVLIKLLNRPTVTALSRIDDGRSMIRCPRAVRTLAEKFSS